MQPTFAYVSPTGARTAPLSLAGALTMSRRFGGRIESATGRDQRIAAGIRADLARSAHLDTLAA